MKNITFKELETLVTTFPDVVKKLLAMDQRIKDLEQKVQNYGIIKTNEPKQQKVESPLTEAELLAQDIRALRALETTEAKYGLNSEDQSGLDFDDVVGSI